VATLNLTPDNYLNLTPDNYVTRNWVFRQWPTSDTDWLLVLTGIVEVDVTGDADGNWNCVTAILFAGDLVGQPGGPIDQVAKPPAGATGLGFTVAEWAPYAALNSVFNLEYSVNAGYAVNEIRVELGSLPTNPDFSQERDDFLWTLEIDVAARDTDGQVLRVGYNVTLSGQITPYYLRPAI